MHTFPRKENIYLLKEKHTHIYIRKDADNIQTFLGF